MSQEYPTSINFGAEVQRPTDEWLASIGRVRVRNARGEDTGEVTSVHEDPTPVLSPLSDDLVLAVWNSHRYELWTTNDKGELRSLLVKGKNIVEKMFR